MNLLWGLAIPLTFHVHVELLIQVSGVWVVACVAACALMVELCGGVPGPDGGVLFLKETV